MGRTGVNPVKDAAPMGTVGRSLFPTKPLSSRIAAESSCPLRGRLRLMARLTLLLHENKRIKE